MMPVVIITLNDGIIPKNATPKERALLLCEHKNLVVDVPSTAIIGFHVLNIPSQKYLQ